MSDIENLKLKELIHICYKLIPKDSCVTVVDSIKKQNWVKHEWARGQSNQSVRSSSSKELDVLGITPELEEILNPFVSQSVKSYNNFIGEEKASKVTIFSPIRFNRYKKNQLMRRHSDHIRSLFNGDVKGIPTLSIIINLNDNYEGGDLEFWDEYKVHLGEGDVVVFPSLFLFPHRIEAVTRNVRYSGVTWGI